MPLRACLAALALGAVVLAPSPARAQDKSTYYTVMHPKEFEIDWLAFYTWAEAETAKIRKALPHKLDVAYGADAKQKLDVYSPASAGRNRPVFVFLHGGGMREGDRAQYGYIAGPLARHDIVTVVPSYRLTPANRFPDQLRDVALVLEWITKNIAAHGGDPGRVYLSGHSAGAILTATTCTMPQWLAERSVRPEILKGCVPISGSYDLRGRKDYDYAPDPASQIAASPILHLAGPAPPTIVAVGSGEPQLPGSRSLADALRGKGSTVTLMVLKDLRHDQTAGVLGDEQNELTRAILRMIAPSP